MTTAILSGIIILLVLYILLKKFKRTLTDRFDRVIIRVVRAIRMSSQKALLSMAGRIMRFHDRLLPQFTEDPYALKPLTPVHDAENVNQYEIELSRAILNPVVQNIALTGPYGSGKSSIIRTFFHHHPQFTPLYVSLADFKADATDSMDSKDSNGKTISAPLDAATNEKIEYSILQQLFYRVKDKHIPFSRFKRIRPVSFVQVSIISIITFLFLLAVLYCFYKNWQPVADAAAIFTADTFDLSKLKLQQPNGLALMFLVLGSYVVVYYLIRLCRIGLIKLNLQGAEIQISKDSDVSILNKHMDEILYFFATTRSRIMVLEDLDRFHNPEIFIKLREINRMLNNSMQVGQKVTFIYALRDDVFKDEQRTKFFDLIIPVVPQINASNSADELINSFSALKLDRPIPETFLNALSDFITDKRLILNIINEFIIYRSQLERTGLNNERLLSIIVYKNLFPDDFTLLQENKGMIFDLFRMKGLVIKERTDTLTAECNDIEKKLHELDLLVIKSIRELRLLFLSGYFSLIFEKFGGHGINGRIGYGSSTFTIEQLTGEIEFNTLRRQTNIFFENRNGGHQWISLPIAEVESKIGGEGYSERLDRIERTLRYDRQKLTEELNKSRALLQSIRGFTFNETLKIKPLSEFETPVNESECLAYLIRNGHIREKDYKDYLSYFKEGQLSIRDREFISAVYNALALPEGHSLDRVDIVAGRITLSEYGSRAVYNNDLVVYLVKNHRLKKDQLDVLVESMAKSLSVSFEFIEQFRIHCFPFLGQLLSFIIIHNPQFWLFMVRESKLEADSLSIYLQQILLFGEINAILSLNVEKCLKTSISEDSSIMQIKRESSVGEIVDILEKLQVKFRVPPPFENYNTYTVNFVYKNNLYELNPGIINFFLQVENVSENITEYNYGQLTHILDSDLVDLATYIKNNLSSYIEHVYLKNQDHHNETPETVLWLLKEPGLDENQKTAIVAATDVVLALLSDVPSIFWGSIFQHYRIRPTWQNMYISFKLNQFSPFLLEWLQAPEVYNVLATEYISESEDDEVKELDEYREMLNRLMELAAISFEVKMMLANAIGYTMYDLDMAVMDEKLVKKLFPKLGFSIKTAISLKTSHTKYFHELILKNWNDFKEEFDSLDLQFTDIQELLKASLQQEQRFFVYEKQDAASLISLLQAGAKLPLEATRFPGLRMTDLELLQLKGRFGERNTILLITANLDTMSEDTVKLMLESLDGHFKKIANRQGKEVKNDGNMRFLVEALQKSGVIIASFEPKVQIIEVAYLPTSK